MTRQSKTCHGTAAVSVLVMHLQRRCRQAIACSNIFSKLLESRLAIDETSLQNGETAATIVQDSLHSEELLHVVLVEHECLQGFRLQVESARPCPRPSSSCKRRGSQETPTAQETGPYAAKHALSALPLPKKEKTCPHPAWPSEPTA